MTGHFKYTRNNLPLPLDKWMLVIMPLYLRYVPFYLRNRRNIDKAKLTDVMVLAFMCWQVDMGITNQTKFYRFLKGIFVTSLLPERSRFNRICNNEGIIIRDIRLGLIHDKVNPSFTIIDSFPMPLCQPVRNFRAKLMSDYANKGYNSTKKFFFYGYKAHCEVSNSGIVLAYSITRGSVHDVNVAKTLLNEYPSHLVLANKGYVGQNLKNDLKSQGIDLETPGRSNMKSHPNDEPWIIKHRLRVETTFSQLKSEFNVEHNHGRTTKGYQTRFEQCLLVDTYRKLN